MTSQGKRIWKFEFDVQDKVEILMPGGATVVAVGTQGAGRITIWAMCNPGIKTEKRTFLVRGTGHPLDGSELERPVGEEPREYLGTIFNQLHTWHVFGQR